MKVWNDVNGARRLAFWANLVSGVLQFTALVVTDNPVLAMLHCIVLAGNAYWVGEFWPVKR